MAPDCMSFNPKGLGLLHLDWMSTCKVKGAPQ